MKAGGNASYVNNLRKPDNYMRIRVGSVFSLYGLYLTILVVCQLTNLKAAEP